MIRAVSASNIDPLNEKRLGIMFKPVTEALSPVADSLKMHGA